MGTGVFSLKLPFGDFVLGETSLKLGPAVHFTPPSITTYVAYETKNLSMTKPSRRRAAFMRLVKRYKCTRSMSSRREAGQSKKISFP